MNTHSKTKHHLLMVFLVLIWGFEFAVRKDALSLFDTVTLLCVKYGIGSVTIGILMFAMRDFVPLKLKDLPRVTLCALLGHLLYFYLEYEAMAFIPIANLTIILGLLPVATVLVERMLFKRKFNKKLIIGMLVCFGGIIMVIGDNMGTGSIRGYIYCVIAVCSELGYLFATQHVQKKYSSSSLAFYQCVIAFLVTLPHGARHMPPLHLLMDTVLIIEILYIGILCVGIAFYLEILGIEHFGPIITGVYLNFLPVISSIGVFLIVHESLTIWQITGGIIVIAAGIMVIREKERLNQIVVK